MGTTRNEGGLSLAALVAPMAAPIEDRGGVASFFYLRISEAGAFLFLLTPTRLFEGTSTD